MHYLKKIRRINWNPNTWQTSEFVILQKPKSNLKPDESTIISFGFRPKENSDSRAVLHIKNNSPNQSDHLIYLSGRARSTPQMAISSSDGKQLQEGGSPIQFGKEKISSSRQKTIIISNHGKAALRIDSITISGHHPADFKIPAAKSATLHPGETLKLQIRFKPRGIGTRKATLHIRSNDFGNLDFLINFSGSGKRKSKTATRSSIVRLLGQPASDTSRRIFTSYRLDSGTKFQTLTVIKSGKNGNKRTQVEVSPDLVNWFSGPDHTTIISDLPDRITVSDNTPVRPGTKRYIRMRHVGEQ